MRIIPLCFLTACITGDDVSTATENATAAVGGDGYTAGTDATVLDLVARIELLEAENTALADELASLSTLQAASTTAITDLEDQVAANAAAIGSNTDSIAANTTAIDSNGTAVAVLESELSDGLADLQSGLDDAVVVLRTDESWWVQSDTTCDDTTCVGDLETALAAAARYVMAPGVRLTLNLSSGTHTLAETVVANHASGGSLVLTGTDASSEPTLVLDSSFTDDAAFQASGGATLVLEGVALDGGENARYGVLAANNGHVELTSVAISDFTHSGVMATASSTLVATDVTISDCAYGVYAESGSSASVDSSALDDNNSGVYLNNGAVAELFYTSMSDNSKYGLYVGFSSFAVAGGCAMDNNEDDGARVRTNALLYANDSTFDNNGNDGLDVNTGMAYLSGSASSATDNGQFGVFAWNHSTVRASTTFYSTVADNASGDWYNEDYNSEGTYGSWLFSP